MSERPPLFSQGALTFTEAASGPSKYILTSSTTAVQSVPAFAHGSQPRHLHVDPGSATDTGPPQQRIASRTWFRAACLPLVTAPALGPSVPYGLAPEASLASECTPPPRAAKGVHTSLSLPP